jgi:subtilase family serine protease
VWNNSSGASGGGTSAFFSRPSWQTGTGVPTGTKRVVPDISLTADPSNGAVVILNGQQVEFGGTSWSSPTWAGFSALINQSRNKADLSPIGQLAPLLYPYLGTANLRDITSGNNKFQSSRGFTAGTGYDRCTGVGVPDIENLTAALAPTSPPSITDGPATSSGEIGAAYSFTYTASGAPAPTFSLASGSQLPTGITLSTSGLLAGTPTQSGVFTGTVTASNGVSPNATQAYTLTIDQPPAVTSAPISATVTDGSGATFTLTATGFPAPTFAVTSGNLPSGLSLSSSGVITGTPTEAGTFSGVITVSNGVGAAVVQSFSITVDVPTDTPTLPPVALAVLGASLLLIGVRGARLDF